MKRLELKVTKRTNEVISFCIRRQSHRRRAFGYNGFYYFEASNGIVLRSLAHPEIFIDRWDVSLCVRGSDKKKDRLVLKTSIEKFKMIEQAVAEYNEHFKGE